MFKASLTKNIKSSLQPLPKPAKYGGVSINNTFDFINKFVFFSLVLVPREHLVFFWSEYVVYILKFTALILIDYRYFDIKPLLHRVKKDNEIPLKTRTNDN